MAATIRWAATKLNIPCEAPDNSECVSGRSLRVAGAQGLSAAGWDIWTIQLLCRFWVSDTVLQYMREDPLLALVSSSPRGLDFEALVFLIMQRVASSSTIRQQATQRAIPPTGSQSSLEANA